MYPLASIFLNEGINVLKILTKVSFLFFGIVIHSVSFAISVEIQVDAGTILGSSQKIAHLLGIQGVPYTIDRSKPDQEGVRMWRELDLNMCDIGLFHEVSVLRNANGKLELDFTGLDSLLDYITKTLGTKQIYFSTSPTPKALSSNPNDENSSLYVPAKYEEWEDIICRTVLHLKNKWGLAGAHYQVWGEPETYAVCFRGRPGRKDNDVKILDDYVELYIHSWKGVKKADPTAQVGGPGVGVYSSELEISMGHSWGMDNFIEKLAGYNRQNPNMKVTLDEVLWQDYDWRSDGGIAIGVKHVQSVLKANGFPIQTPQALMGWNKNADLQYTQPQLAVYIAAMMIEQLNLGELGLSRAYFWPFDYDFQAPNSGLVTIPYPEQDMGGEEGTQEGGWYGKRQTMPAVTKHCRRPAYAGFQMLAAMKEGQFIKTTSDKLPKGVQVMATRDNNRVIFMVANNSSTPHEMTVYFSQLPYGTGNMTAKLQRIDETHSVDCQGLEVGSKTLIEVNDGKQWFTFEMPLYSVAQISLER